MNRVQEYIRAIVMLLTLLVSAAVQAQEALPEEPPEDAEEPEETQMVTYADLIDSGDDKVQARFIGLTGGIIVGAEVVMAVEAALKVKKVWPYVVMPLFGAGAGGVGGYFLEKNSVGGSMALFVVGVALIIPTAILVKSARAYDPEEEETVGADMEEGAKYSFEKPPEEGAGPRDETTTEVERRPEPPPPSAPQDGPTSRREPTKSRGDVSSRRVSSESGMRKRKQEGKRASIRRATAGSLVFIDRDGSASLSMPHVDVRPAYLTQMSDAYPPRTALRVFVPLLRVDLP